MVPALVTTQQVPSKAEPLSHWHGCCGEEKSWQGRSREREVTFLSGCFVCYLGVGWKKDFAGSIKEAIV